jgi:hypothetical protein
MQWLLLVNTWLVYAVTGNWAIAGVADLAAVVLRL